MFKGIKLTVIRYSDWLGVKKGFYLLVAITLLFSAVPDSKAQQWPSQLWHEGKVILLQGDTLKGFVKYDLQQDLVQFSSSNNHVEAFSARKVLFFEIFDKTVNRYRQFFALPYNASSGYKTPVFFELLEEGKLTLLTRETLEYRTYNTYYYYSSYSRLVLVYKYFFMTEDGNIVEFHPTKNNLLDMMGRKAEDVEKYMKSNRLKVDEQDKYDLARIVAYYNSLFGT
jgi:hypothetical protein